MTYKQIIGLDGKTPLDNVVMRSDGAFIPFDPQNRDYAEYLAWIEAGNTPLPAEEQTGQNPV